MLWNFLLFAFLGCQTTEYPAPILGTTYRIGEDKMEPASEINIDLMTTWGECIDHGVADLDACLPRADRGAGEMQVSFRLKDPQTSTVLYRSITEDQIRVTHDRATQNDLELIPHEPVSSGQLFILLIDGSGSMYENDGERIQKVYQALLNKDVVNGFFPEVNGNSGVVLLRFADSVRSLDGGQARVIRDPKEYQPSGGYTHLYDAVKYSVTELLNLTLISDYLTLKGAEPTIVVLTDGFNNEAAADTCADNAPRLQQAVDVLREQRTAGTAQNRPTVFTVGLGKAIEGGRKPKSKNIKVTAPALCGTFTDRRIDGDLEDYGIDAVSLQWMAEAGGGLSFVRRNPAGLAEVFQRAARPRYRWYEVRYRTTDALYHRKSFDVEVQLTSADLAITSVQVFPSAWLDAPSGRASIEGPEADPWVRPTPFRESIVVLMVPLGNLIILFFAGPAWFNARRGVFRRARLRR